jgi:hypothetical protein
MPFSSHTARAHTVHGGPLTYCGIAGAVEREKAMFPRDRARGGSQIRVVDPKLGTRTCAYMHAHQSRYVLRRNKNSAGVFLAHGERARARVRVHSLPEEWRRCTASRTGRGAAVRTESWIRSQARERVPTCTPARSYKRTCVAGVLLAHSLMHSSTKECRWHFNFHTVSASAQFECTHSNCARTRIVHSHALELCTHSNCAFARTRIVHELCADSCTPLTGCRMSKSRTQSSGRRRPENRASQIRIRSQPSARKLQVTT